MKKQIIPGFLLALFLFSGCAEKITKSEISSPGNINTIQFELLEGVPYYSVRHGEKNVVNPSKLGIVFSENDVLSDFKVINSQTSSLDETWEQVWGEKRFIRNNYNQLSVTIQEKTGKKKNGNSVPCI